MLVSEVDKLLGTSSSKPFWDIKNNIQRFEAGDTTLRPAACIGILKLLVGYKLADVIYWLFGKEVDNGAQWPHRGGFVPLKSFKVRRIYFSIQQNSSSSNLLGLASFVELGANSVRVQGIARGKRSYWR